MSHVVATIYCNVYRMEFSVKKKNNNNNNYKRCLSLRMTCTNLLNTLRKRTGGITNAETRHRHANSPSSPRQRHETPSVSQSAGSLV